MAIDTSRSAAAAGASTCRISNDRTQLVLDAGRDSEALAETFATTRARRPIGAAGRRMLLERARAGDCDR
jgi:hypothetical protein